jgi:hypothetical protein
MATITAAVGGGNWGTTTTWVGSVVPTADSDVLLTVTSGNVTIDGTSGSPSLCRSLDCTGYTGTLTHAASKRLQVGDGTAGDFTLVSGMTYVPSSSSSLFFVGTSGTATKIKGAGKTFNLTATSGTSVQMQDNCSFFTVNAAGSSTVDFNGKTFAACSSLVVGSGSTMTFGAAVFTSVSGACTFNSGGTVNGGSETATFNNANIFDGGGKTFGTWSFTGTTPSITGANTFATLTRTGTAAKTNTMDFDSNQTVTGTFTCNGNSAINRMQLMSATLGTAITISAGTVTVTNTDFRDITGAGAGSWNLAAITGKSGDCGGNSGITFTTGANMYWFKDTGNFSTTGNWFLATAGAGGAGRCPLPQDTGIFDASSFSAGSKTVTQDMPRMGAVDFSAATNNPALTVSVSTDFFGSVVLGVTQVFTASITMAYRGRGSSTFNTNGNTWVGTNSSLNIGCINGTLTLAGAFTMSGSSAGITLASGTFNDGSKNITLSGTSSQFQTSSAVAKTLVFGSGNTWSLGGRNTLFDISAAGTSVTQGTALIDITDTSSTVKGVDGGSKVLPSLTIRGAAACGAVTLVGSNTFITLTLDPDANFKFTSATTTTVTTFTATGTSGHVITIASTTAASAATLAKASGTVSCDYLSLKDNTASGNVPFYAGANSTNVSGNTNWTFTVPPAGGSGTVMVLGG